MQAGWCKSRLNNKSNPGIRLSVAVSSRQCAVQAEGNYCPSHQLTVVGTWALLLAFCCRQAWIWRGPVYLRESAATGGGREDLKPDLPSPSWLPSPLTTPQMAGERPHPSPVTTGGGLPWRRLRRPEGSWWRQVIAHPEGALLHTSPEPDPGGDGLSGGALDGTQRFTGCKSM